MKASSIVMIWVVVASLVCGETLRAVPKLGSKGKSIATSLANTVGMRRLNELRGKLMANFTKPVDGGHSPVRKAVAIAAIASTCWWGTISLTGCGGGTATTIGDEEYYTYTYNVKKSERDVALGVGGFILVLAGASALLYLIIAATLPGHHTPNIEQHHLGRGNLFNHSMEVDNETYRGVLITYRYGADTRTGLAYSPQAPLVFSTQGSGQGRLGFAVNDSNFQAPEEITVKHPDGKTPDTVISLSQVKNVLLTEEPILQELPLGE